MFAASCLRRIIAECCQGDRAHFDLSLAKVGIEQYFLFVSAWIRTDLALGDPNFDPEEENSDHKMKKLLRDLWIF